MAGRFSVETVFKAVDRVTAPVRRMQTSVARFARNSERNLRKVNKVFSQIGDNMKSAGLKAAAALAATSVAMLDVIRTGAQFGRAIGSAAAKFPEQIQRGTAEFKALETAARDVGKTTEFTATQAAQGLNFLAKAGFNAQFSIKSLKSIVDFATAAEIDFATAADIASDSLGAFGLDSTDVDKKMAGLQRVMDVMSMTANRTNTSVEELFESAKDGAPIASAAGVSIETFSAAMGFLASNGIKASKAGTAAKNITLALAGVGNKAAEVFKRMGISLDDGTGNLRDQFDVLDELRDKMSVMGTAQRVPLIEAIFGKIPIAAASKLLDPAGASVRGFRKELEAANGSSKRTAEFIRNDVQGSMDSLSSAIEGVKISLFSMNEGPLKRTIDRMTEWVRANESVIATRISEFISDLIMNFDEIVRRGKQVAGVIALFVALSTALKVAAVTMGVLNLAGTVLTATFTLLKVGAAAFMFVVTAMPKALAAARVAMLALNLAFTLNPVGLIVAGVTTLIALAALLITAWEPVTKFFNDMWASTTAGLDRLASKAASIGEFFGFDFGEAAAAGASDDGATAAPTPQVVSPQERTARSVEEQRTTSSAEVVIRDDTGRAEVASGNLSSNIQLQQTGAF